MIGERYDITDKEREKVLKKYINDDKLTNFPSKEKKKYIILQYIINYFDENEKYSEKEVNDIIKKIHNDVATIRRYLVIYGLMDRNKDCSFYWVKK